MDFPSTSLEKSRSDWPNRAGKTTAFYMTTAKFPTMAMYFSAAKNHSMRRARLGMAYSSSQKFRLSPSVRTEYFVHPRDVPLP